MKSLSAVVVSFLLVSCANQTTSSSIKEDETPSNEGVAPAAANAKPKARWVCNEYDRDSNKLKQRTVILSQTDDQGLVEGSALAFAFELYEGSDIGDSMAVEGKVEHEDVNVNFTSADGKVTFGIFLDEMNESSLTIEGEQGGDYVCRDAAGTEAKNVGMVCTEYDRDAEELGQRTVVLTQTDGKGLVEGEKLAFDLAMFTGAELSAGPTAKGTVETEDVSLTFTGSDDSLAFHVFLDEMNESSLTVGGENQGDFICR